MPRQFGKGGAIAALTGVLLVTGVCAAVVTTDTEFRLVASALAKDKGHGGDGHDKSEGDGHDKSEHGKGKGGGHGHGGNGGHGGHGGGGHNYDDGDDGDDGGHQDQDNSGGDQGDDDGGPDSAPSVSPASQAPAPSPSQAPAAPPSSSTGVRQDMLPKQRGENQGGWNGNLKSSAGKTDAIKTSSVGKKRKKTLMDMLAEPPKGKSRMSAGKPKRTTTLVDWFAERQGVGDGKKKKAAKRQKVKLATAKRTIRRVARADQARAYAYRGIGLGAMEKEFRARFFSREPQMLAMRTYVLELAAFESARSLMVDAAADLDDARRNMLALDITPFQSLRGTIGGGTSEAALDPAEVATLIVARQKLADAQENLAIKAQRVDFHMLCDLAVGDTETPRAAEMSAQYYGSSAFVGLFDVIDPLEHPAAVVTASQEVRADLPVTRGKKGRVNLDAGHNTADARL